jgi:hypothetical protein
MFAYLNTQTAFALPIRTVQTYFSSHKNTATNTKNKVLVQPTNTENTALNTLLVALQGTNAHLLDIQNGFLDLTKTDAMQLLPKIQPLQPLLHELQTQIPQLHATNETDRLILKEFDAILQNIAILFNDIVEIANDEIDENSLEFQSFLVDFAHNSLQEDLKANGGKRTAHTQKDIDALFD